jgi:hypothetical protein
MSLKSCFYFWGVGFVRILKILLWDSQIQMEEDQEEIPVNPIVYCGKKLCGWI